MVLQRISGTLLNTLLHGYLELELNDEYLIKNSTLHGIILRVMLP
jgi:hypothetical protein